MIALKRDQSIGFVPFPADRAQAYRTAGYWTGRTLDSLLRDGAAVWPDRTAIADESGRYSYSELDARADRCADGFAALGIRAGDRVLLQLPNYCGFAVALFGLLRAGAIPVMCLPGHRAAELSYFCSVADAVALVITDTAGGFDYRDMAAAVVGSSPGLRHVIVDGDAAAFIPFAQIAEYDGPPRERPAVDTSTPALLLVSGGTTGFPKLIPRTHDDYVYNAAASAALCQLTADDVYLVVLPAAHNFPLACPGLLGALSVGATTVFTQNASPESAFVTIDRHRVTVTALVPALAKVWAQACE